jgi:hypothetical protein
MKGHVAALKALVDKLDSVDSTALTEELRRIRRVASETVEKTYPWQGTTCRSVGDLLIALQSKVGKVLISSNYKEHGQMHEPLDYRFRKFPLSDIRSK